jgi:hypothetical protein
MIDVSNRWTHGAVFLGWAFVLSMGPAASCPAVVPPPPLPLPHTADPPPRDAVRASLALAVGSPDLERQMITGAAVRGSYSPVAGMIVGAELSGGGRYDLSVDVAPVDADSTVASRIFFGYGHWIFRRRISLAGEIGLTPGLHSAKGGFLGPDATLSLTAGGQRWWALTLGYRLAYLTPTRPEKWKSAVYHVIGLTAVLPRHARFGFFLQVGAHVGDVIRSRDLTVGVTGVAGFRFSLGLSGEPPRR